MHVRAVSLLSQMGFSQPFWVFFVIAEKSSIANVPLCKIFLPLNCSKTANTNKTTKSLVLEHTLHIQLFPQSPFFEAVTDYYLI